MTSSLHDMDKKIDLSSPFVFLSEIKFSRLHALFLKYSLKSGRCIKILKIIWYDASFSVDALPCKIAFEMGKVRNFWFLALSAGTSGWILVAEETLQKPSYGIVRVVAPLAGCNVRIDVSILILVWAFWVLFC